MRRKLVAGNWKMFGSLAGNERLLDGVLKGMPASASVEAAVCVPFPYLGQARDRLRGTALAWGAQNLSQHAQGAYTGEVSAAMIVDFGCRFVIVGHSERRSLYGDTDAVVAAKYDAALKAGLTPILCLGESLEQRESGVTNQVVGSQLDAVMDACGVGTLAKAVIAYEPVWAIGTGRTASPQQAQDVHAMIRERIAGRDAAVAQGVQILYGGSVKPQNAREIFSMGDIDGGLIGGASLVAEDFLAIINAAV
jgi:triosephosphate isomerase